VTISKHILKIRSEGNNLTALIQDRVLHVFILNTDEDSSFIKAGNFLAAEYRPFKGDCVTYSKLQCCVSEGTEVCFSPEASRIV
jgi:hypothetical protein